MRIQSGTTSMQSVHIQTQSTTFAQSYSISSEAAKFLDLDRLGNSDSFSKSLAEKLLDKEDENSGSPTTSYGRNGLFLEDDGISSGSTSKTKSTNPLEGLDRDSARYQFTILALLLRRIFYDRMGGNTTSQPSDLLSAYMSSALKTTETYTETYSYYESESTSVDIMGQVQTSDGRNIDFNVNLTMSREFQETYSYTEERSFYQLMDPLVVNLDVPTAAVSDLDFTFDLDSDGKQDEVASLRRGSGFLALDRNGDGKINNGSELFGTKTGDGFKELSLLDTDGDGWIDEDDDSYKDLRVWIKDSTGRDRLLTLKEADVGAICVNAVQSEFSLKNSNQDLRGQIGQTGVFLHENGQAGTIQHVDLGMKKLA